VCHLKIHFRVVTTWHNDAEWIKASTGENFYADGVNPRRRFIKPRSGLVEHTSLTRVCTRGYSTLIPPGLETTQVRTSYDQRTTSSAARPDSRLTTDHSRGYRAINGPAALPHGQKGESE